MNTKATPSPKSPLPALAITLAFCTQVCVAAADPKAFDIERGNLASALTQFAAQSDRQILFSTDTVAAKRSNPIKGELEPEAALRQLLKGTGLTYRVTSDNTILVETPRPGDTANLPVSASVRLAQVGGSDRRSQEQLAAAGVKGDPQDPAVEEVVVNGFRESLAQAHALKRDAVVAEDVIVAEDIAAFPDLNLAES